MLPAAAPDTGSLLSLIKKTINLFVEFGLRNLAVIVTLPFTLMSEGRTSAELVSEWRLALILADASMVAFNLVAPTCFKRTPPRLTCKTFHLSWVLLPSSSCCSSSTTSLYSAWQGLYLSAPMWRRLLLKSLLFLWLNSSRHIYHKVPRQGGVQSEDDWGRGKNRIKYRPGEVWENCGFIFFQFMITFLVEEVYYQLVIVPNQSRL